MVRFLAAARTFLVRQEGPTMVEYALMIALIALVAIGAVTALGGEVSTIFTAIKNSLAAA